MKNWVIVDTGYLAALANPKDRYHALAVTLSQTITEDLITTWPVITELCHYLNKRVSPKAQALLIKQILSETIQVVDVMQGNLEKAIILLDKYSDLPMDLADASLVILAEELGHGRILSTDMRDFNAYRWKNHKPFQNLLLPDS
ncbi:MAG: type II toxin-antitoxin system VapC family toxin [Gammaproteobacteria bacterium]